MVAEVVGRGGGGSGWNMRSESVNGERTRPRRSRDAVTLPAHPRTFWHSRPQYHSTPQRPHLLLASGLSQLAQRWEPSSSSLPLAVSSVLLFAVLVALVRGLVRALFFFLPPRSSGWGGW